MDILLTADGDIYEQTVTCSGWQQSLQSVLIRIHRFRGEWILNPDAGLNYIGWMNQKSGNLLAEVKDQMLIEIQSVRGVLEVRNLRVRFDEQQSVDVQASIILFDPENPDTPVVVELDTFEGTTRVSY